MITPYEFQSAVSHGVRLKSSGIELTEIAHCISDELECSGNEGRSIMHEIRMASTNDKLWSVGDKVVFSQSCGGYKKGDEVTFVAFDNIGMACIKDIHGFFTQVSKETLDLCAKPDDSPLFRLSEDNASEAIRKHLETFGGKHSQSVEEIQEEVLKSLEVWSGGNAFDHGSEGDIYRFFVVRDQDKGWIIAIRIWFDQQTNETQVGDFEIKLTDKPKHLRVAEAIILSRMDSK